MTLLILAAILVLIAIAMAAVVYRIFTNPRTLLVGGFILAGLFGLELAVIQTIVERAHG